MMWRELGALLTAFLIGAQTAPLSGEGFKDCPELKYQTSFDLDQLMGDWYAVEIVEHNIAVETNTISTVINSCPILQLTREDNMAIRLQWNENRDVWTYRFLQPKPKHPGLWDTTGHQDDSVANRELFSGTVRVMKAVRSHMVLTFCSRSNYNKFSVLMSRTRRLPSSDYRSVNSMLTRRGLPQGRVKEMCKGIAAAAKGGLGVLTLLLVAKFLIAWP